MISVRDMRDLVLASADTFDLLPEQYRGKVAMLDAADNRQIVGYGYRLKTHEGCYIYYLTDRALQHG